MYCGTLPLSQKRRDLSLGSIAEANLRKTSSRWLEGSEHDLFDEGRVDAERLPRSFSAELRDIDDSPGRRMMRMTLDGESLGAALTDNSYDQDGYRFHDLFHLSLAATLGWSPVIRTLLHRKRKSDALLDEVEDGGRAIAIEEGLTALVFAYASQHSMLAQVKTIDWGLLQTCSNMTLGLEVRNRQLFAWEQSIIRAYEAWRAAIQDGGVRVFGDLNRREFRFERLGQVS